MTANHIMIDFETIGGALSGKIAFVGFMCFDPFAQNTHEDLMNQVQEVKFNWAHPEQDSFDYVDSTLKFWSEQPLEIRKRMLDLEENPGESVTRFCEIFEDYLHSCGFNGSKDVIWARGTNFDITILERLYASVNKEVPYPWWRARDVRTFVDALNLFENQKSKQGSHFIGKILHVNDNVSNHDARYDIANDIVNVQQTISRLYTGS